MNRLRPNSLPVVTLRDALSSGLDALPDAELVERFARYGDHAAFEVLLRRHGPMVLGVCRRTLPGWADADDAFQATFLVFLRKARTVRGERVGPWLYGVAWRVAQKARTRAARLRAYQTEGMDMIPAAREGTPVPDWGPVLDAELAALPAKYREALILCELQGATRAEAAKALGLREGTLSSRLAWGRDLLRQRLLRHGTLLPAGGLAALFSANGVGRGSVPAALLAKVSELVKMGGAAGAVPVAAARLTDEVLKSMFLTKLRITGGALVVLVMATVGLAAVLPREAPGGEPEEKGAVKAPDKRADPKPAGPKIPDREALQGLWAIEKVAFVGEKVSDAVRHEETEIAKGSQVLISGDSWWFLVGGADGVCRTIAAIDPQKNPKWLDLGAEGARLDPPARYIYELDGDILRLCSVADQMHARPAEFTAGADAGLVVQTFRRAKMQPAIGEKALVGSWGPRPEPVVVSPDGKTDSVVPPWRVEVVGDFLFAYVQEKKIH